MGRLQFDCSFPGGCTVNRSLHSRPKGAGDPGSAGTPLPAQTQPGALSLCGHSDSLVPRLCGAAAVPGLPGCTTGRASGSAAAATAGLARRNPSPDSPLCNHPEPLPRVLGPAPCFASDQWAQGLPGSSGGATPLPNDTISLIGLAVCCVPKPVWSEHF